MYSRRSSHAQKQLECIFSKSLSGSGTGAIYQQRPQGAKHTLSFRGVEGVVTDAWNTHNLQVERRDKGGRGGWTLGLWDPEAKQLEREKLSKIKKA